MLPIILDFCKAFMYHLFSYEERKGKDFYP